MLHKDFVEMAGHTIEVTNGAAATLQTLMNTALTTDVELKTENAIIICPEDGDIRVTFDDVNPTTTVGMKLLQNKHYFFGGFPLSKMRLIPIAGADCSTSIIIGYKEESDTGFICG